MRTTLVALLSIPAALVAQEATPAAETLTQRYKATEAAVNKLLSEHKAGEALAKVEAFIPAQKPAFDTSTAAAGQASYADYSTIFNAHNLAGKAALLAGEWEKGLAHFEQAQAVAQENISGSETLFAPVIANWQKAAEDGKKALTEGAARRGELKAKAALDDREKAELENFKIHENNVRMGPIAVAKIKGTIDGLRSDSDSLKSVIDSVKKSLDKEKEQLASFKGDKAKYVAAALTKKNLDSQKTLDDKLNFVSRLTVLDPKNTKATRELDKLMGRPVAPEAPAGKAKGGKKKAK